MNFLLEKLNWFWRLLATAFCYLTFGLGGLILSLTWFNLLNIFVRQREQRTRIARRSISASFRLFLNTAEFLGVLKFNIQGADILLQDKGCLVIANHPTLIDYVLIASAMPEVDCMVKSALLYNPFMRGVIKAADYLINDKGDALLNESQKRLEQGHSILIFPEGTRTRAGEKMHLQRGAANIAVRCQKDMRIIYIHCSENILGKQSPWYDVPAAKPVFTVSVRELISINSAFVVDKEPSIAARHLNQLLLRHLEPHNLDFLGNLHASTSY